MQKTPRRRFDGPILYGVITAYEFASVVVEVVADIGRVKGFFFFSAFFFLVLGTTSVSLPS